MADEQKTVEPTDVKTIEPKTPEMEGLLVAGYPRIGTAKKARQIIAEREKDPHVWPYEVYEEAQAFLAAYEARPVAISKDGGWKRLRSRQE